TNLFADDTTTFLDAEDNFEDLQKLLDTWCQASGARFNIAKTQIIPIGTKEYRTNTLMTRKTGQDKEPLPTNLHLAEEGEAIRILGAWYGNEVNAEQVWTTNIEKVDTTLRRWGKAKPTIEGRRHIIQMIVGGITQYLTTVQGMPRSIEKQLTKRINNFLWNEKGRNAVSAQIM
ncbi:hypothetical protein K435DRAFT_631315, partial [Dendrothele bispora CBS 962.96]